MVEAAPERARDPDGEGARVFVHLDAEGARAAAEAADRQRAAGMHPSRFAGIPIAIKDLFDVRGQVTTAGSRVLANEPPAENDAPSIAPLRQAGFVFIGRTNMTEFAYSGLGLNPHYGDAGDPVRPGGAPHSRRFVVRGGWCR